ncbi:MAG: hypothetical protein A3D93_02010 [Acidobacteria bacterium RIFCSPHIGHO2_12_FULL_67_30]|nr:MAG: hypothetical protein A3D93_02010 [Acidobacteria bacterium RIFCSPHIGHO2_12_FULL_67_30]
MVEAGLYSGEMFTTLPPRSSTSIHQCASAILFSTMFLPMKMSSLARRKSSRSGSKVWMPVTMGWPGGRSPCQS